jgi:TatD DNase family protein
MIAGVTVKLFDTHCHLDIHTFDGDRDAVFARAHANGVARFLNPAFDLASSRRAVALANSHVHVDVDAVCAVGIHPNSIDQLNTEGINELRGLAQAVADNDDGQHMLDVHQLLSSRRLRRVVAIGEIGLDYHWSKFPRQQQREGFIRQIELARELGLPVIIHCRDSAKPAGAYADCLEILADHAAPTPAALPDQSLAPNRGILLHAFAGSPAEARFAFERGWYIGVGGPLTYKNAHELRRIVQQAPLEQIVLETDAPYLTPEPHRGQRNEPAHVRLVAERLAELRGMPLDEIAHITFTNASHLFGLAR